MKSLAYSWHCTEPDCDDHGEGPKSNREAERHTKDLHHSTATTARPE